MKPGWRFPVALLLSGIAHGLLLGAGLAVLPTPPPPLEAGRIAVQLHPAPLTPSEGPVAQTEATEAAPAPHGGAPKLVEPEPGPAAQAKRASPVEPLVTTAEPLTTTVEPAPMPPEEKAEAHQPKPAKTQKTATPALATNMNDAQEGTAPPRTVPPEPAVHPGVSAGAQQAVRAELESELARHFHYPLLARRRGWEGEVVLGLELDPRGRIAAVEVVRSSGHPLLDRAAVDALSRVGAIPGAVHWLAGQRLRMELPIIYQLTEG